MDDGLAVLLGTMLAVASVTVLAWLLSNSRRTKKRRVYLLKNKSKKHSTHSR